MRKILATVVALLAAVAPATARAAAAGPYASAQVSYKVLPTVKATVVPNYQSGFGPLGGFGSGSPVAVGSGAVLNGGTVDFGNVVAGYQYLYKYAAQIAVQTNDAAGFVVYGEGATDLNGSNPTPSPATFALTNTLYWLKSAAGNTPFSPAHTFNRTAGTPIAGGANGINYAGVGGTPAGTSMIWTSPIAGNLSQGYDYQLRLTGAIPTSQFNVYIVYTVIGN